MPKNIPYFVLDMSLRGPFGTANAATKHTNDLIEVYCWSKVDDGAPPRNFLYRIQEFDSIPMNMYDFRCTCMNFDAQHTPRTAHRRLLLAPEGR